MKSPRILFCGSTSDSVIVAGRLKSGGFDITGIVTQPERPRGRKLTPQPTPMALWANDHGVAVHSFASDPEKPWLYRDENQVVSALDRLNPDLIISASYGQKIPGAALSRARYGGMNVHPSLLPRWRGGDPVPWSILAGDRSAGVSVTRLSEAFDQGEILSQQEVPITETDTSDPLRSRLFEIGARLLSDNLPDFLDSQINTGNMIQKSGSLPYARRLRRDDGYIPWDTFKVLTNGVSNAAVPMLPIHLELNTKYGLDTITDFRAVERLVRAFDPWPGVWTEFPAAYGKVRLKIIRAHTDGGMLVPNTVQLEGKKPTPYAQFVSGHKFMDS